MFRRIFLKVAVASLFVPRGATLAAEDKPPAEILEPEDGATAAPEEDLTGQINIEGWPVVVVKPLLAGQQWWFQREVKEVTPDGKFSAKVAIGDSRTPKGTAFRIVILVVKSKQDALKNFPREKTSDALPAGVPKSRYVTVKRG